jgi:hypothetical protein
MNPKIMQVLLAVFCLAAIIGGLALGLSGRSVPGASSPIECGSPWSPSSYAGDVDDYVSALSGGRFSGGYGKQCAEALGQLGTSPGYSSGSASWSCSGWSS